MKTHSAQSSTRRFLQGLDAETKLLGHLMFCLLVIFTPSTRWPKHLVILALLLLFAWISSLSFRRLFRILFMFYLLWIFLLGLLFLFPSNTPSPYWVAFGWIGRALLIATSSWLLSASTRAEEWLAALRSLHLPRVLRHVVFFAFRHLTWLQKQIDVTIQAVSARTFHPRRPLQKMRLTIPLLSRIFASAMEQSGRTYAALLARGYNGDLPFASFRQQRRPKLFQFLAMLAVIATLAMLP